MGYYVEMTLSNVVIKKENHAACLKAINALHDKALLEKQAGGGSSKGDKWYAWVGNPSEGGFIDLEEAFEAWRYSVCAYGEDGSIEVDMFNGQKLGDDGILWHAVAPFIEKGGEIECHGEENALWKWVFDGKCFNELTGKVTWE